MRRLALLIGAAVVVGSLGAPVASAAESCVGISSYAMFCVEPGGGVTCETGWGVPLAVHLLVQQACDSIQGGER